LVWHSGPLHGRRQNAPALVSATNTVQTDWDPAAEVPTDDWPAGVYLLRLDADSGAQRYTHRGGAGVFNAGTMRWVEAIYGDQPHGIGGATPALVRQVTMNVLHAFADGPAAARYPAHDNLDAIHEYAGDPIGNPANLQ
jgi:hypothetical protein